MKIHPRIGLGQLRSGMSRDEVRRLLGEPEQLAPDSYGDDALGEAWHDWQLGCSLQALFAFLLTEAVTWIEGEPGCAEVAALDMNFRIEDERVRSIQWSVYLEDGTNEVWP